MNYVHHLCESKMQLNIVWWYCQIVGMYKGFLAPEGSPLYFRSLCCVRPPASKCLVAVVLFLGREEAHMCLHLLSVCSLG